jgi:hypothetical protein
MPAASTDPARDFALAVEHFNAERFRDALLAFEQCYFADRSDFLRGLIKLCNALNQLRLGLVSAPRRTLAGAAELLGAYAPEHGGLDLAELCAYIADVQARIPPGLETGQGSVDWERVPRLRLRHTKFG